MNDDIKSLSRQAAIGILDALRHIKTREDLRNDSDLADAIQKIVAARMSELDTSRAGHYASLLQLTLHRMALMRAFESHKIQDDFSLLIDQHDIRSLASTFPNGCTVVSEIVDASTMKLSLAEAPKL